MITKSRAEIDPVLAGLDPERSERIKTYIPPDLSDEGPTEDDEDDEDSLCDDEEEEFYVSKKSVLGTSLSGGWSPRTGSPPSWTPSQPSTTFPPRVNVTPPWENNGNYSSYTGGQSSSTPTWNRYSQYPQQQTSPFGASTYSNSPRKELPRGKKILICDVLDCLIETYQSGGKRFCNPRGIYDVKPRFDVWDRIRNLGVERIYAIVPKSLILSASDKHADFVLMEYIALALTEYLRLPQSVCQIVAQTRLDQSKADIITDIVKVIENKDEIVSVGMDSGGPGQGDFDIRIASDLGIDYIDLNMLLQYY